MSNSLIQYARADGLEVHEAEDGLIVFNPATDHVHHLNTTAGVIFELCEKPITVSALGKSIQQFYSLQESPQETINASVVELVDKGLLIEQHNK